MSKPDSKIDVWLMIAGWLALVLLWCLVIFNYNSLPDSIPTHFNARGEADDFGSKGTIFLLPVIGTFILVGMSILVRHPTEMKYYAKVTPEKAAYHYAWAKTIVNYYNVAIPLVFCSIVYDTIKVASGESNGLAMWSLIITLVIILGPIPYFLIKIFKH